MAPSEREAAKMKLRRSQCVRLGSKASIAAAQAALLLQPPERTNRTLEPASVQGHLRTHAPQQITLIKMEFGIDKPTNFTIWALTNQLVGGGPLDGNVSGLKTLTDLAVLRLITRSNLFGRCAITSSKLVAAQWETATSLSRHRVVGPATPRTAIAGSPTRVRHWRHAPPHRPARAPGSTARASRKCLR